MAHDNHIRAAERHRDIGTELKNPDPDLINIGRSLIVNGHKEISAISELVNRGLTLTKAIAAVKLAVYSLC